MQKASYVLKHEGAVVMVVAGFYDPAARVWGPRIKFLLKDNALYFVKIPVSSAKYIKKFNKIIKRIGKSKAEKPDEITTILEKYGFYEMIEIR